MSNRLRRPTEREGEDGDHLAELPDGAGCFEIWEHLSDRRKRAACD